LSDLEKYTLQFWNAAHFRRRAPGRDQTSVSLVLGNVAIHTDGRLHDRAVAILKEIDIDNGTDDSGGSRA
jgi:hypothetical protein